MEQAVIRSGSYGGLFLIMAFEIGTRQRKENCLFMHCVNEKRILTSTCRESRDPFAGSLGGELIAFDCFD